MSTGGVAGFAIQLANDAVWHAPDGSNTLATVHVHQGAGGAVDTAAMSFEELR